MFKVFKNKIIFLEIADFDYVHLICHFAEYDIKQSDCINHMPMKENIFTSLDR